MIMTTAAHAPGSGAKADSQSQGLSTALCADGLVRGIFLLSAACYGGGEAGCGPHVLLPPEVPSGDALSTLAPYLQRPGR